jgi:hypothetical protein
MRRDPDVRQVFVERAGTLVREFAAMEGVRIEVHPEVACANSTPTQVVA